MVTQDNRSSTLKIRQWLHSDAFPRIVPFALFMAFVALGSVLPPPVPAPAGELDVRWIYAARAIVVGVAFLVFWSKYSELRAGPTLRLSDGLLATMGGVVVLVIWVHLDSGWTTFELASGFDPRKYGSQALDLPITVMRFVGMALVVPVIEELFWRSYLMRWLEKQDFLNVDPASVSVRSLLISSGLFALEHSQWLAGLIAGLVYGWLYVRTRRLWVPVIAHTVTNGLLGAYILVTHDWRFW